MDTFKKQSKVLQNSGTLVSTDKFNKNPILFSNKKVSTHNKQNVHKHHAKDQKLILGKNDLKKELLQLLANNNKIIKNTDSNDNIFGNKKIIIYDETFCLKRHDNVVIKYKVPQTFVGKILLLKIYSNMDNDTSIKIYINDKLIPNSSKLLNRKWVTLNYVDGQTYDLSNAYIYIESLSASINVKGIYCDVVEEKIVTDNINVSCTHPNKLVIHKNKINYEMKLGIIADIFTYENLNYLYNCVYIRPEQKIIAGSIDILFCESVWGGIDEVWRDEIYMFDKNRCKKIISIVNQCKKLNIPTIFYAKEDPIFFEGFKDCAILFDLIVTTSIECVNKYKQLGCKKVMYTTFLINPLIHNPIKQHGINNRIAFPGSYYQFIDKRVNIMENILDANHNNNILDIYDRQYIHNKMTDQIKKMCINKDKCKFPDKYSSNIYPCLTYSQVVDQIYKKYKCVLNINSISDSKTMFSRRVMEVAGCGTNIISSESIGMKNIFGKDIFVLDKSNNYKLPTLVNNLPDINVELYEKVHLNYTYKHLFKKLFRIFDKDINLDQSVCIILADQNIQLDSKVKTAYTVIYNDDINIYSKFDWVIQLKKKNYYHDSLFVRKLLLATEYVDSNISISKNTKDIFKFNVKDVDVDTQVLKAKSFLNDIQKPLSGENGYFAINNIYNVLRQNPINYLLHINDMDFSVDENIVPVIMCVYRRIDKLADMLSNLNKQTFKKFHLFIWNNDKSNMNKIKEIVDSSKTMFKVSVHHSPSNIGGYGRFVMAKHLIDKHGYPFVIFVDDDQILGAKVIDNLYMKKSNKTISSWSGRKFIKNKGYWESWSNIYSMDKNKHDTMDYGGTGTMIIDSEIFRDDSFFYINKKYLFIEDLWLSYYSIKYHNYKILNANDLDVKVINDGKDQSLNNETKKLKEEFLQVLREKGGWSV